jgi:hypothetical protein
MLRRSKERSYVEKVYVRESSYDLLGTTPSHGTYMAGTEEDGLLAYNA